MASSSVEDYACKKLFDLVHGAKTIIDTYLPKCCNSNGLLDEKVIRTEFNKAELCSLAFTLMKLLSDICTDIDILNSFKKDIKSIHKNHEENLNLLFQKFTQKIACDAKNELTNQIDEAKVEITCLLSQNKQTNEKPKLMKKHISNEKQVLVVNIDEN